MRPSPDRLVVSSFTNLLRIMAALIGLLGSVQNVSAQAACSSPQSRPDKGYAFLNDNTEVQDSVTGLVWQRCSAGQTWSNGTCTGSPTGYSWSDAGKAAANLAVSTLATGTDATWRVPTFAELTSLVDQSCTSPQINPTVFPGTRSSFYWTSDQMHLYGNSYNGYCVWFGPGTQPNNCYPGNAFSVRLVRGTMAANKPPTAKVSDPPTPVRAGTQVSLSAADSIDIDGTITYYFWNFGDGSSGITVGPSTTHTYAKAGTYTVTLSVTDNSGAQDSTTLRLVVAPPTHQFSYTVSGLAGQSVAIGLSVNQAAATVSTQTADGTVGPQPIPEGAKYLLTVVAQPSTQICTVSNGEGTVGAGDVTAQVTCANAYSVGGKVVGLATEQTLTLYSGSGVDRQSVSVSGVSNSDFALFTLPKRLTSGAPYDISFSGGMTGLTCTRTSTSGTVGTADVSDVNIDCENVVGFDLKGLLSGQSVTVTRNGSGSPISITATTNGTQSFAGTILSPYKYYVNVSASSPGNQPCSAQSTKVLYPVVTCTVKMTYGFSGLKSGESVDVVVYDGTTVVVSARNKSVGDTMQVPGGGTYTVVIDRQPRDQKCTMTSSGSASVMNNTTNKEEVSVTANTLLDNSVAVTCSNIQ